MKPSGVGLHVPNRPALLFAKTPLYMGEGTQATTITPVASRGHAAGVPARICTANSGPIDSTACTASTVVLDGRSDQPSSYLGGQLSTNPHMCLALPVSPNPRANTSAHRFCVGSANTRLIAPTRDRRRSFRAGKIQHTVRRVGGDLAAQNIYS